MNGLRELLEDRGFSGRVDVVTLFAFERGLGRRGDRRAPDERSLDDLVGSGYACVVADNLVERMTADRPGVRFVPLPHAPLSSRRYCDRIPQLVGPEPDGPFVDTVIAAASHGASGRASARKGEER